MTQASPLHRATIILISVLLCLIAGGCTLPGTAVSAGGAAAMAASQERGLQGAMRDQRIRLDINHYWLQESEELFRKVNLQVRNGRVLLTGKVGNPDLRVEAVRLAWKPYGVTEVINEIEVTNKSSLTSYARDTWINTQLKTKLLIDKDVAALNYSIETVNQVVYLIGLAQNQQELDRVVAHAKDVPYVRRVVNYVSLKANQNKEAQAAPSS